ncbi:pilus assembly protein PilC [candidate division GN15 bacterium]|uniref:Pilus assembly protein PilC n=1 Tax=candidate division GN15 bacterium TaxID=2072418 RepID=A0A855X6J8_9BACT|nr:MAG: pilus assembly protein PilC [candidate division GN15 bacterium]
MPVFEYKGKTLAGAAVQGSMKANSKEDMERVLRQNRILVTSINKKAAEIQFKIGTGVKKVEISRFTRQFATMIGAGLPMIQCLDILATQTENKEFGKIITQVKDSVQGGATLSESLARHPKVFDPLYTNMVEAGEVGGALDAILVRLAVYREKADKLVRKVKGAMMYPAVIVVVATGVTIAMLTFIVPVFAGMFKGVGSELPAPTQVVLDISNFLKSNYIYMLLGLIGAFGALFWWKKTPAGALAIDRFMIKTPVLGTLIRKSSIARFTRTLSTLLASGVSILEALEITAKTSGNLVVSNAINKSVLAIAEGETITGPLKETGVFPPMVIQMIGVGEKTGGLDDMLNKIADFYDEEVNDAVAALTSIIEPVIIVFMGAIIGGILIAMYLPMFDIIGKIG